jgi:hypothetical protein
MGELRHQLAIAITPLVLEIRVPRVGIRKSVDDPTPAGTTTSARAA